MRHVLARVGTNTSAKQNGDVRSRHLVDLLRVVNI